MELTVASLNSIAELPREEIRTAIFGLQDALLQADNRTDLACFPVRHTFAPGCYAREMTIPEGQAIIGKIHRHAHVNVISLGRARVLSEFGVEELQAPCTFTSQPGIKRVVLALEDTVWTTIHVTDETDLEKIEAHVIASDYSDIEIVAESRRLE